ncbi:uncharacterized protein G2W53_042857 [Senna tora]|uniref:Uncharacterized protein n=1 Tax=Senna tora TaxID=362788 RepID=A0A834SHP2_9FABA|nr:uncharacterized protein G2W53_042857 [Senna tora]
MESNFSVGIHNESLVALTGFSTLLIIHSLHSILYPFQRICLPDDVAIEVWTQKCQVLNGSNWSFMRGNPFQESKP